jgi:hypothetical protein
MDVSGLGRRAGRGSGRRRLAVLSAVPLALAIVIAAAIPANAGRWIPGGTFDIQRGVPVSFLRFLAGEGEGQMTIRCDARDGLWIDAGVAGNAQLPLGLAPGDTIEATLVFVRAELTESVTATGPLLVRADGAVLVSLFGAAVEPLGPLLLRPADRVEITIAGETRPVPLDGVLDNLQSLADRCGAWPM